MSKPPKLRIGYASDIHLEFSGWTTKHNHPLDYYVLAGDIFVIADAASRMRFKKLLIHLMMTHGCDVILVLGNHEYYRSNYDDVLAHVVDQYFSDKDESSNISRMENVIEECNTFVSGAFEPEILRAYGRVHPPEAFVLHGSRGYNGHHPFAEDFLYKMGKVVFIGGTLWTDFDRGSPLTMMNASYGMNDFRAIRQGVNNDRMTPERILEIHRKELQVLEHSLDYYKKEYPDYARVVVTHHGPSIQSIDARFKDSNLNGCYVSNLEKVAEKAHVWIHGHVHASGEYEIGPCKVLRNPRGYQDEHHHEETGHNPGKTLLLDAETGKSSVICFSDIR